MLKVLKIGFIACVVLCLLGGTLSLLFQHILTGTQPNYPAELKIFLYAMIFVELIIVPFIMWKFFRTSLAIFIILNVLGMFLIALGSEKSPATKPFIHFVIFFIVVIIPLIVLTLSVFADKEKILADKRFVAHPYRWATIIIAEILLIFYVSSYVFYDFGIIFH